MNREILRAAVIAAAAFACGGRAAPPEIRPLDRAVEAEAVEATAITEPVQIVFDWRLQDRDARFSGQGVARIEPGRARVDLFGPRGEGYLSAILDDLELRLPPGVGDVPLPPPPLFWSVLGVFRPPSAARLTLAARDGNRSDLQYTAGSDVWRFRLDDTNLQRAEWTSGAQGRRTVELSGRDENGVPREATYRDWPAFLELKLVPTQVRNVNAFPADIWTLERR